MYNTCFFISLFGRHSSRNNTVAPKKRPFFRSRFCRRRNCRIGRLHLRHREGISGGRRAENGLFGGRINPLLGIGRRAVGASNRAETY